MKFAIVGDITLHYSLEGANEGVPLVLINSLGTDLRLWDPLVPHFANRFPIIRYDKRGRELAATLRNARFELIEQAGHLPCVEQPEAMADKINQFFQELLNQ